MSFDKSKAMRNAERYLAQGKIRHAIAEYRQVIDDDPKDFSTMNMLGDLYVKDDENKKALYCYKSVAEHYANQGFAQKAIAVYNKAARLDPNSIEVAEKLAELYRSKGSIREARAHYETLAEHYRTKGKKIEALSVWNEIAQLDPHNTEVYVTLASSYLEEGATEEAAEAFRNAGMRFAKLGSYSLAIEKYERSLELRPFDIKTLSHFVESKFETGGQAEAAERLAALSEQEPHNRELLGLLIDCHMKAGNLIEAEAAVIRLVELEPANYPRFLELASVYLNTEDLSGAARILSMSSEHLLVGGQAEDFRRLVNGILDRDPDHLDGLRMLTRHSSWQRDEAAFLDALERLAEVAARSEAIEDERYALTNLVRLVPQDVGHAERLREINEKYGYDAEEEESLFDRQFFKPLDVGSGVSDIFDADVSQAFVADTDAEYVEEIRSTIKDNDGSLPEAEVTEIVEENAEPESNESRLERESESIRFYIDNGYTDLAKKAIKELRNEFGDCDEIRALRRHLKQYTRFSEVSASNAPLNGTNNGTNKSAAANGSPQAGGFDLRSELGLDEPSAADDSDYDTHYHTATAYREMGLLDDAIKEFQEAVAMVTPSDGTRRFFQCATLLGHCFMEKGMPAPALKWFQRTLDTPMLSDEEKQGIWYELAAAYEAEGDLENAERYYEQVYAENIDFRDVSERIRNIAVDH